MNGEEMEELKEGWRKVKLGEILNFYNGKKKIDTNYNGKYNIYGASGIIGKSTEYLFEGESIILGRVGAYCGITFYERDKIWSTDNTIVAKTKTKANNLKYFYYLLKYLNLNKRASGSAQPLINQKLLSNIEVEIPALFTQKKIVSILSLLDEKIELNRKINQNLEEAAQTLFKRWFIDFEFPNEEGKPYKSSGGKMIESELGEIPEGWRVGKLGEIIEINPKENLKKLEKKIYIEMKCLSETSSIISEYYEREFTGTGTKFKNKDTLMARITPCLENGKIGYVNFLKDNDIGWGSTEFNILRSQNNLPKELSYFIARSKNFLDYAISNMNGSSGRQRVNGKILEEYNIVISPENIYKKFGKVSNSIMNQIENNRKEIEKLIELRDYLLPRLMSGEISV
jgi:type I restriction enzyme S subunit